MCVMCFGSLPGLQKLNLLGLNCLLPPCCLRFSQFILPMVFCLLCRQPSGSLSLLSKDVVTSSVHKLIDPV